MALTYTPSDELGNLCPDFTLPGVDGKTYLLKQFLNGNPVVIMFICNHCPYVKAIEDRLIELGNDLKKRNVSLVAISSNDETMYPEDSFAEMKKTFFGTNSLPTFKNIINAHLEAIQLE